MTADMASSYGAAPQIWGAHHRTLSQSSAGSNRRSSFGAGAFTLAPSVSPQSPTLPVNFAPPVTKHSPIGIPTAAKPMAMPTAPGSAGGGAAAASMPTHKSVWQRRGSLGWEASPHPDMQPNWSIWGPAASGSYGGSASFSSVFAHSPPRNVSAFGAGDSPIAGSPNSRLWFGNAPNTSGGLSSPPLTPQTSPSAFPQVRDRRAQSSPQSAMEPYGPVGSAPTNHGLGASLAPAEVAAASPPGSQPASLDDASFDELMLSLASAGRPLYFVSFKSGRMDVFTVSDKTAHPIAVGDLVIVDADRGRDLGKVAAENVSIEDAAMLKWRQHQEQRQILHQCAAGKEAGLPLALCTPKQILRAAQPSETQPLPAKTIAEAKAVAFCNQKAQERGLDMVVVDAEYQWDRRKLTFYYKADQRVDFRDLVRELFRTYKTRIWMCAVASA